MLEAGKNLVALNFGTLLGRPSCLHPYLCNPTRASGPIRGFSVTMNCPVRHMLIWLVLSIRNGVFDGHIMQLLTGLPYLSY